MNIYVSNLSFHTTDDDLRNLFEKFGAVSSAKVIMDKVSGRSRGFGFVEMSSEEEGKEAMSSLNNKEIEGRAIAVSIAKEKEARTGGGGGYNRGGSGGGGGYNRGGSGGGGNRW
jgi:RNA recognition motif-containing protein